MGQRTDGCDRCTVEVGDHGRVPQIKGAVGPKVIALFGNGQRDDSDLGVGDGRDHRLGVFGADNHPVDRGDTVNPCTACILDDHAIGIVPGGETVAHHG